MTNWKLRLGSALTGLGFTIAGLGSSDPANSHAWLMAGLIIGAAGQFWKSIFPETEGGQKAADQLPETNKP
jgi:hypothetical protein